VKNVPLVSPDRRLEKTRRTSVRLTATNVRALFCQHGKTEQTYFDSDLPGFGLRIRASGAKSWLLQYAVAGKTKKIFLGKPNEVDAGKARDAAKDLLAAIRLGRDPAQEKVAGRARAKETVSALLPHFLARQRARLKPRSYLETERHLLHHAKPLHNHPIELIDRRMIAKRLAEISDNSGPAASNNVRTSLSALFSWAAREGFVEANPVSFTNKAIQNGARERVLADGELRSIWLALEADDYGEIVKLLMLTGARRHEIGALRWSEVDLQAATITLPPARTNNGREHIIPLSAPALAILQARTRGERDTLFGRSDNRGFQNWSLSKRELDARLTDPLPAWVLHDFRRAVSTALHERFGVPPHIVEAILGHVDGHKAGVAGTYNKALYTHERARVLERWGEHILAVVTGQPTAAQIIKLR
jgi:integrase